MFSLIITAFLLGLVPANARVISNQQALVGPSCSPPLTSVPDLTSSSPPPFRPSASTSSALPSPSDNNALLLALQLASSEADRLAILLPDPADPANITHTFINNTGTSGTISLASVDVFPALVGTNVAMAIGFLNPCSLNTPHSHPRGNEFFTVVQGRLQAGLILEGNPVTAGPLAQVNKTLTPYEGMLFPQGMVHFQFNPECEPAVFAAAFDNNDPGRIQIARTFFSVRPDSVIKSSVGETITPKEIAALRGHIPSSVVTLIAECAARCGI
ncbi:MAG: hypothetical protein Q9187_008188 [Circinaria calcarea]